MHKINNHQKLYTSLMIKKVLVWLMMMYQKEVIGNRNKEVGLNLIQLEAMYILEDMIKNRLYLSLICLCVILSFIFLLFSIRKMDLFIMGSLKIFTNMAMASKFGKMVKNMMDFSVLMSSKVLVNTSILMVIFIMGNGLII